MMLLSRRSLLNVATSTAVLAAAPQISSATGSRKTLRLGTRQIEVDGKAATRYRVTQPSGQVGLTLNQGEEFNVKLENGLPVLSGLHWHGMTEPWRQDGVPYRTAHSARRRSGLQLSRHRPNTFWDRFENPSSVRSSPIAGEPRSLAQLLGAELL